MRALIALCFMLSLIPAHSVAQPYPSKPIKILIGYPPGGSVDATARVIAERLSPVLGQPVITDHRPGATGNIAGGVLAKASPDGYTLYMGTSINTVSVSLFKELPYDPVRDFAPIYKAVTAPNILVVHSSVPAKNVKELVAYAKANPGKVSYGTTGPGSSPHLCAALLSTLAGIEMLHVPYKGGAQVMTDLLSGQINILFSNPTSVMQHVHSGRIRALAVTTVERFSELPDMPTMIEEGFPGFDLAAWYGVIAPAGTPKEIVNRLNSEIGKILEKPDVKRILAKQGLEAQRSTPEQFAKDIKDDIAKYAKLLKDAGIQPQ